MKLFLIVIAHGFLLLQTECRGIHKEAQDITHKTHEVHNHEKSHLAHIPVRHRRGASDLRDRRDLATWMANLGSTLDRKAVQPVKNFLSDAHSGVKREITRHEQPFNHFMKKMEGLLDRLVPNKFFVQDLMGGGSSHEISKEIRNTLAHCEEEKLPKKYEKFLDTERSRNPLQGSSPIQSPQVPRSDAPTNTQLAPMQRYSAVEPRYAPQRLQPSPANSPQLAPLPPPSSVFGHPAPNSQITQISSLQALRQPRPIDPLPPPASSHLSPIQPPPLSPTPQLSEPPLLPPSALLEPSNFLPRPAEYIPRPRYIESAGSPPELPPQSYSAQPLVQTKIYSFLHPEINEKVQEVPVQKQEAMIRYEQQQKSYDPPEPTPIIRYARYGQGENFSPLQRMPILPSEIDAIKSFIKKENNEIASACAHGHKSYSLQKELPRAYDDVPTQTYIRAYTKNMDSNVENVPKGFGVPMKKYYGTKRDNELPALLSRVPAIMNAFAQDWFKKNE